MQTLCFLLIFSFVAELVWEDLMIFCNCAGGHTLLLPEDFRKWEKQACIAAARLLFVLLSIPCDVVTSCGQAKHHHHDMKQKKFEDGKGRRRRKESSCLFRVFKFSSLCDLDDVSLFSDPVFSLHFHYIFPPHSQDFYYSSRLPTRSPCLWLVFGDCTHLHTLKRPSSLDETSYDKKESEMKSRCHLRMRLDTAWPRRILSSLSLQAFPPSTSLIQ